MTKRYASSPLASALKRFTLALHQAYPQIASTGYRPIEPGLFIGEIAGKHVRLVPGARNSRLFIGKERTTRSKTFFRWGFDLFKKQPALRWEFDDDETRAIVWLTIAAIELEALVSE